jgi:AraC-like DNA-binding protein
LKDSVRGHGPEPVAAPAAQPSGALRQVVEAYLDDGAVLEIHDLARLFDTSDKAIQRELRKAGTTFQALLDDVRRQRALRLVGDPAQSLTSIAYGLGYTDAANFSRAFKRWTGRSPRVFRRRLGEHPQGPAPEA